MLYIKCCRDNLGRARASSLFYIFFVVDETHHRTIRQRIMIHRSTAAPPRDYLVNTYAPNNVETTLCIVSIYYILYMCGYDRDCLVLYKQRTFACGIYEVCLIIQITRNMCGVTHTASTILLVYRSYVAYVVVFS